MNVITKVRRDRVIRWWKWCCMRVAWTQNDAILEQCLHEYRPIHRTICRRYCILSLWWDKWRAEPTDPFTWWIICARWNGVPCSLMNMINVNHLPNRRHCVSTLPSVLLTYDVIRVMQIHVFKMRAQKLPRLVDSLIYRTTSKLKMSTTSKTKTN